MMIQNKRKWSKGEMAKTVVIYCLRLLTIAFVWAACLKTYAVLRWGDLVGCDLGDVLTYVGAAFGAELACLAFKRVFAKKNENPDEYN